MDSLIIAAGRALAGGDPLGALKRVALRDDPDALALRGVAMAQLGDFTRARALLRRAARAFGPRQPRSRARCVLAEAEVALAARELLWPARALAAARQTLAAHGDPANVAHAWQLTARRLLLVGRLAEAERILARLDRRALPPALQAVQELLTAGIAMRRLRTREAQRALELAATAARRAGIAALQAEIQAAARALHSAAARRIGPAGARPLHLAEVEALLASPAVIVDACRRAVRHGQRRVPLARRPVLFVLVRTLAEAWPQDVSRELLVARAFRGHHADESYRSRLRVEMGRLRAALATLAAVEATRDGYRLLPGQAREIVVLAPPVDGPHADLLALLADGESWSTSALALALGVSQRGVQRALEALAQAGRVQCFGRARARRWTAAPLPGITTTLLLPAALSSG
ncbi:MAG: helix-turn-helix domain-containing protein [Proteobacteria bacterium]|nr:helix-turn-helix domain-containing protein [Pseudomonadota bacterium]